MSLDMLTIHTLIEWFSLWQNLGLKFCYLVSSYIHLRVREIHVFGLSTDFVMVGPPLDEKCNCLVHDAYEFIGGLCWIVFCEPFPHILFWGFDNFSWAFNVQLSFQLRLIFSVGGPPHLCMHWAFFHLFVKQIFWLLLLATLLCLKLMFVRTCVGNVILGLVAHACANANLSLLFVMVQAFPFVVGYLLLGAGGGIRQSLFPESLNQLYCCCSSFCYLDFKFAFVWLMEVCDPYIARFCPMWTLVMFSSICVIIVLTKNA